MANALLLLVEDNGDDAVLFRRILKQLNKPLPLEVVTSGEEAISYIQGNGRFADRQLFPFPSIMLLDERLPGKSGTEVLDWIKSFEVDSPLFVATLTGEGQWSAPIKTLERFGKVRVFNCHFLKPATLNSVETLFSFYEAWHRRQAAETIEKRMEVDPAELSETGELAAAEWIAQDERTIPAP